jgi:hypothetical protein
MTGEMWGKENGEKRVRGEKLKGARAMAGDRFNARAANSI